MEKKIYNEDNFGVFNKIWLIIKVFSNFKWVPFLFMGHDGCLWGQKHCFNDIFIWKLFPTQYRHNITFTQNYDIYVGAFAWKSLLMVQQNIAIAHLLVSYGCAPFTRLLQFYMPNDFDFPCLKMISLLYMKSSQLETPLFITTYSMVLSLFWIIKRLLLQI